MWNPLANLPPSNALAPYATQMMGPPTQIAPVPPGRGGGAPLNPIYGGAGGGRQGVPMTQANYAQYLPPGFTMPPGFPMPQVQGLPGNEVQAQVVGGVPAPDGGVSATNVLADPQSFRAALQAWRAQRPAMPDWQALIADARANGGFDMAPFDAWRQSMTDWRGQRPTRQGF